MDFGLKERILPSIRRLQILLVYRNGGVANPETFGQVACTVGRLPIRFSVGTGGTIRRFDFSRLAQMETSVRSRARSGDRHDLKERILPSIRRSQTLLVYPSVEWTTEVHSALRELNLLRLRSGNLGRYLPLPAHVPPRLCRVSTNLHNKQLLG